MSIALLTALTIVQVGSNEAEKWLAAHFGRDILPPFSFTYAGKPSGEFIRNWRFTHWAKQLDKVRRHHIFTYTDHKTNLQVRCECIVFKDFPAIEWVVKFKNDAEEETPIIEDIQALDVAFARKGKGDFILHRALGSSATRNDFAPVDEVLKPNAQVKLAPVGGRSSNTTALPFFNLEAVGEGGVMSGIGWSGQWAASFVRDGDLSVQVRAGMELTHLKLYPGEEIRTPRILLLFWQGHNRMIGHNLIRRFILKYHTLQKDGKPVMTPLCCVGPPGFFDPANKGAEFNDATEHNQIAFAQRYRQLGLKTECWWIDAGWFEGYWPNGVGNWFPRKDGFPNGLRPISDAVKKLGMGFLLWFEPERVFKDTWLDREHPDWILRLPGNPNGLLNLGKEEARRWLTDHISDMIEREGISIYRQDFNIDPLPYWRAMDEPDRQGITEIRHIEGLYAFWDDLLKRHPGLIIDNCASGGRRIDLETISRSIPLWRTDYQYFEPTGYQCHTYGINFYLPLSGTGNNYPDNYTFRSSINSGLVLSWNLYSPDFPLEQARRLIAEYKRIRPLFYGDYYPLTPHSTSDDVWMAYQFHRDDLCQGMVLAFRRPQCPTPTISLKLKGLAPKARYEVRLEDSGVERTFTGKELAEGLEITIDSKPGAALVTYRLRK